MEMSNLKEVNYIVSDAIIADLLGRQNFNNAQSAVLELIKNSYDASASVVELSFLDNSLTISDNGRGMDAESFKNYWLHVGVSGKDYSIESPSGKKRVTAGAKGIGRFALARLGEEVEMYSWSSTGSGVHWKTDWVSNQYEVIPWDGGKTGTRIVISKLRDKWTSPKIRLLADYLGIACNQNDMEISIQGEKEVFPVEFYYSNPEFGRNYVSEISLRYDAASCELTVDVSSDEFSEEAEAYYQGEGKDLHHHLRTFSMSEELKKDWNEEVLTAVGPFDARLFFSLKYSPLDEDREKFCYKYSTLKERYTKRVCLYRNAFSISGYDGSKDWLELGGRARRSPAAATHQSGAWRVRDNQLSGYVEIDKHKNSRIAELSNRQGIEESEYYECFKAIIHCGIAEFERYRQEIIKCINVKNQPQDIPDSHVMADIEKGKLQWDGMDREIFALLREEIVRTSQVIENLKNENEKQEYSIRLMNTLSTMGLKAASIAHDLSNKSMNIGTFINDLRAALKKHDVWDMLNDDDGPVYYNVPCLMVNMEASTRKLYSFISILVGEVKKDRFTKPVEDFGTFMSNLKKNWMADYGNLSIEYELPSRNAFALTSDVFGTVFDNLILNSVQQNEDSIVKVTIRMTYDEESHELAVHYEDDGVGLSAKYADNPRRILEVHETTRENGHGLGMWIVNDTILSTKGEISSISTGPHFSIEFTLGGC